MATGGHFGWPKITFDRISRHFRSLRNFYFCNFFSQNGCRRPFWMTENHFWSHFSPFQINTQLFFFTKWLPAAILDDRKSLLIAFLTISVQYTTFIFLISSTKWLPAAILDDRKSLSITFLAISDQYATFILFFFTKWLPAAILDDRKSLSNAFLAISDQYATFFFLKLFFPAAILEVPFGPFWMTENHFRSHFSPFQINTQLFFFQNGRQRPFWKSDLRQKQ